MKLDVFGASILIDEEWIEQSASEIRQQAAEFERGERLEFDLDVDFPDDFTGRVMKAMAEIPAGKTRTYGELAGDLDTAPRAIGGACGRNPVPLVIPCHRVVGVNGLTGYSADGGLDIKHRLLVHEGAIEG